MRRLLLILALCHSLWATAPSFVQKGISSPGSPVASTTIVLTTTAGDGMVFYARAGTNSTTLSVTSSQGGETVHTDARAKHVGTASTTVQYFWVNSTTGGPTTYTMSTSSSSFVTFVAVEYSAQNASTFWDACGTFAEGSGTSGTTSVTTSQNDELLVGIGNAPSGQGLPTGVTSGYTLRESTNSGSSYFDLYYDNTSLSTAGSQTFTMTFSGSEYWITGLCGFKAASPTPPSGTGTQLGVFVLGP